MWERQECAHSSRLHETAEVMIICLSFLCLKNSTHTERMRGTCLAVCDSAPEHSPRLPSGRRHSSAVIWGTAELLVIFHGPLLYVKSTTNQVKTSEFTSLFVFIAPLFIDISRRLPFFPLNTTQWSESLKERGQSLRHRQVSAAFKKPMAVVTAKCQIAQCTAAAHQDKSLFSPILSVHQ